MAKKDDILLQKYDIIKKNPLHQDGPGAGDYKKEVLRRIFGF